MVGSGYEIQQACNCFNSSIDECRQVNLFQQLTPELLDVHPDITAVENVDERPLEN